MTQIYKLAGSSEKISKNLNFSENISIFATIWQKRLTQTPKNNSMIEKVTTQESLDEKDILILRTLQQNAKLTTKQVAAECHLSLTPVFERIKRLENEGYIKRYITVLDAEKLHKGFVVFCSVKLSTINREMAQQFTEAVRDIPEVTECYNISGKFDYLLKIHSPNMKYYQEFILNVLGKLPMLGSLESTFVMEEIKHQYGVVI